MADSKTKISRDKKKYYCGYYDNLKVEIAVFLITQNSESHTQPFMLETQDNFEIYIEIH